jgi:hypothetical protein
MRLVHLVRGFGRLRTRDRARLVAAWVLLGLARLTILVLPFTLVRRALGEQRHPEGTPAGAGSDAPGLLDHGDREKAARIGATVALAARHTPWRSECYPQALAARVLLAAARLPHVVSFGVRRDGDALVAHAWVHAGDVTVTGGTGHRYTRVGAFAWTPRTRSGA